MNSFERCVFHLDLRVQVIRFPKLLELVEYLSSKGFDAIIIEWEASYPYDKHTTISNRYAYSREEISILIKHAARHAMEVIPLQQCFGHVEYILRHDRYAHLREDEEKLGQVCPYKSKDALQVFREMMEDMIKLHPSPYFHIGGDETRLLGHCPDCAEVVRNKGISYLYAKYLKEILDLVKELGKVPLLWADIILKYPEHASILPKEAVFIDWNYGWAFDKFGDSRQLLDQGFTFWGAPAIRSDPDNYWLTCWNKHLENFREFIPYAKEHRYQGIILTSWSTSGEYGYFKDSEKHLTDILPWRRVYPLQGFNLLIEAFQEAVNSDDNFDPDPFLINYGSDRFGLPPSQAKEFSRIIRRSRVQLARQGIVKSDALTSRADYGSLRDFRVDKTRNEWDHLLLIARLECHQLELMLLEAIFQDSSFSRSSKPSLRKELVSLSEEADIIDSEFRRLNGKYLHLHELETEIQYRRYRLDDLIAKVNR